MPVIKAQYTTAQVSIDNYVHILSLRPGANGNMQIEVVFLSHVVHFVDVAPVASASAQWRSEWNFCVKQADGTILLEKYST